MTPNEFELLIKDLFSRRLKNEFGYDVPVNHLKTFTSLTGNSYKIDLSYSFTISEMSYLNLVECKYWNSHVTREKVGYFKSIIDDLKAHKGIIVTTKGFQSGALKYAKSQNIGLIKILNNKDFKIYANANGELPLIQKILIKEEAFNETMDYTSVGVFSPLINLYDFISINYGKEVAEILKKDYSFNTDRLDSHLSTIIREQLLKMPNNWYENYIRIETAGLRYQLQNEGELRLANMKRQMLKQ